MRNPDVDTSFGIYFSEDGHTKMGNKIVKIVGDNLIVDNDVYTGTKGLWTLITGATKKQIGNIGEKYNEADVYQYIKLLQQISALHQNFDPKDPHPRSSRSWKWKNFLKNIWEQLNKQEDVVNNERGEENENQRQDIQDDADNVERGVEGESQTDDNETENIEQGGCSLRHDSDLIRGGTLYVHKNGLCCSVWKLGKGLYLSPHPPVVVAAGDGLYIKTGFER